MNKQNGDAPRIDTGFEREVETPLGSERVDRVPDPLKQALLDGPRPCGEGRFAWEWGEGPAKSEPISVYCAEPLCLQTGSCTGPRFVPHMNQVNRDGAPRRITPAEAVLAARTGGELARRETGRPDERSDSEISHHVGTVWDKARAAVKGGSFK